MSNPRETDPNQDERSIKRESIKGAVGELTSNVVAGADDRAEKQFPKSDAKSGSTRKP